MKFDEKKGWLQCSKQDKISIEDNKEINLLKKNQDNIYMKKEGHNNSTIMDLIQENPWLLHIVNFKGHNKEGKNQKLNKVDSSIEGRHKKEVIKGN